MADKCKSEKKALDEAERDSESFEYWFKKQDENARDYEAEAQRELGSIGDCIEPAWSPPAGGGMRWHTEGEYRLDEDCVIDKWVRAHALLEDAQNARELADSYVLEWQNTMNRVERLKNKYCDCLNRESPD